MFEQATSHLEDLRAELAAAESAGLTGNALYIADLRQEMAIAEAAYRVAALTEIATLRGRLGGRQQG